MHSLNEEALSSLLSIRKRVKACYDSRTGADWCRMSESVCGWNCRLLTLVPSSMPVTEKERGLLFSKVYSEAKEKGILDCPFFDESAIDRVVEDTDSLTEMMNLKSKY